MCSTEVATWAHKVSGHGGAAAVQRQAESRHIPLAPSEAQNASKHCSACQQKRLRVQMAMWQIPWWEGPQHSWQVTLMAGGSKRLQTGPNRNRH